MFLGAVQRFGSIINSGLSNPSFTAIVMAMGLSLTVRMIGLLKEVFIAALFGISAAVDTYILSLLLITFFAGPFSGSIGTILTRKLPEIKLQSPPQVAAVVILQCFAFSLIGMCVVTLCVAMWQLFFTSSINFGSGLFESTFTEKYVLLPIGILSAITLTANAVLSSEKRFLGQNVIPATVPISIIIGCIIAPKHLLLTTLFTATVVGYAVETSLTMLSIRRAIRGVSLRSVLRPSQQFCDMMKLWGPMFLSGIITSGCVVVDQVMAALAGEGAVATVNYGSRLTLGILSISSVLWLVLYPQFNELAVRGLYAKLKKTYVLITFMLLTVGLGICSLISFHSEFITSILFERGAFNSSDTAAAAQFQALYLLHIPFNIMVVLGSRFLSALELVNVILIVNILLLAINVVLNFIFVQFFGVLGIAIATLISYAAMSTIVLLIALFVNPGKRNA